MALQRLVTRLNPQEFKPVVVSLTQRGVIGARLEESGVRVIPLASDKDGMLLSLTRLVRVFRDLRPSIVQTWMYHGDLVGGIAARFAHRPPVVWGIRSALRHPDEAGPTTRHVIKACAISSRWLPDRIVSVSESGRQIHESWGYPGKKILVIPNGFDLNEFRPDAKQRAEFRDEIGVSEDAQVVTNVGRIHPHKDHATLLTAVAQLVQSNKNVHLALVGEGTDAQNADLIRPISSGLAEERLHLLGPRHDVARVLNGSDIYCSSSIAEAFPNSVGEAMACQIPCVVTEIGDSARLVGDTGVVVPVGDASALANGISRLIALGSEGREQLGQKARDRIAANYDIHEIVNRYQSLYLELAT